MVQVIGDTTLIPLGGSPFLHHGEKSGLAELRKAQGLASTTIAQEPAAGRWRWVTNPPQAPGEKGRVFDVQGLVLALTNGEKES